MRSDTIKRGFQRAPHRALLHACGLSDEDIDKPFIGIANSYCEIVPGHVHLNKVGRVVKQAVREAGGTGLEDDRRRDFRDSARPSERRIGETGAREGGVPAELPAVDERSETQREQVTRASDSRSEGRR